MSMFDSVFARCPNCGEEVEFRSKAGVCYLCRYNMNSVPAEIAQDLIGATETCKCGEVLKLTAKVARVRMELDVPGQWD